MHPIIAACALAVLVGSVLAVRWGHLEVVPPWSAVDDVSASERLRRALWFAAVFTYGAVASGLLVLGPGGRLVMRLLAVTADERAQGRLTEADEIVGVITVGGTIDLVIFVGLFGGLALTTLYVVLRKWLPPGRGGALIVGVLFAVLFSTRVEPLRPRNTDFVLVGPPLVAVAAFLAVGALTMLTTVAVAARVSQGLPLLERRAGALLPYVILIVLTPAATMLAPAAVLTGLGIVLLGRPAFRRLWAHRNVVVAGRIALAGVLLAFVPSFVEDIADILG